MNVSSRHPVTGTLIIAAFTALAILGLLAVVALCNTFPDLSGLILLGIGVVFAALIWNHMLRMD